jgi:hypothetical protein
MFLNLTKLDRSVTDPQPAPVRRNSINLAAEEATLRLIEGTAMNFE